MCLLLSSLWPYVNFYNTNIDQDLSFSALLPLMTISTLLPIFVAFAIRPFVALAIWVRISIASSALILSFYSFPIAKEIAEFLWGGHVVYSWFAGCLAITLTGYVVSKYRTFRTAVLVFLITIVTVPVAQTLTRTLTDYRYGLEAKTYDNEATISVTDRENYGSIFLLILDGYARSDILKEQLGFDNTRFVDNLAKLGFHIVEKSRSNFHKTKFSIPNTLAMDYIFTPGLGDKEFRLELDGGSGLPERVAAARWAALSGTEGVGIISVLKKRGYKTGFIADRMLNCYQIFDYCYQDPRWFKFGEVEKALLSYTPLLTVIEFLADKYDISPKIDMLEIDYVEKNIEIYTSERPVFLIAHFWLPHSPYRFAANCELRRNTKWDAKGYQAAAKPLYLDMIKCGNKQILSLIGKIIYRDEDAIIVLQSDHGSGFLGLAGSPEAIKERHANLNALRLPEKCRDYVYPSMTLVNTFRLVLACLDGTKPDFIEDAIFTPTSLVEQGDRYYRRYEGKE